MTGETYPTDDSGTTANLSYTFDSMGRLNTMTDNIASKTLITGASYGPANELLTITGGSYGGAWAYGVGETRTYNSLKQLTEIVSGTYSTPLSITYHYPSTGNNGKISSQTDNVSGEQVSYTYDALNRLSTAANQSGFSPLWGQQFTYDGFGNLTEVSVTQGSAPTLTTSYDYNNHAGGEDSNGNPGSIYLPADGSSYAATYDVENRLVATGSSTIRYSYAPGNRRVWRGVGSWNSGTGQWSPTDEVTFWSVNGQKLATYQLTTTLGVGPPSPSAPQFYATQTACNYYFGGKLIKNVNGWVYSDRLASIGKFYPYGIERPSATSNGTEKFTGYFRDSESGNDYAVNRYMSPGYGRFITPDPNTASGDPGDPGSWNRYAYVNGDPINFRDPDGLLGVCISPIGGGDDDDDDDDDDAVGAGCVGGAPGGEPPFRYPGCAGGNGTPGQPGPSCPPIGGLPRLPFAPGMPAAPTISGTAVPRTLQGMFNAAWSLAMAALTSPACDSVYSTALGTLPITTAQLWTTLENATYTYDFCISQGQGMPTAVMCTTQQTQTVILNALNPSVRGFNSSTPETYAGTQTLYGAQALEMALLHELGHLEGLGPVIDGPAGTFNQALQTNCLNIKTK